MEHSGYMGSIFWVNVFNDSILFKSCFKKKLGKS